ncbi:vegetative cell wall protein gp1-like [Oryza sativa Japonica Group]
MRRLTLVDVGGGGQALTLGGARRERRASATPTPATTQHAPPMPGGPSRVADADDDDELSHLLSLAEANLNAGHLRAAHKHAPPPPTSTRTPRAARFSSPPSPSSSPTTPSTAPPSSNPTPTHKARPSPPPPSAATTNPSPNPSALARSPLPPSSSPPSRRPSAASRTLTPCPLSCHCLIGLPALPATTLPASHPVSLSPHFDHRRPAGFARHRPTPPGCSPALAPFHMPSPLISTRRRAHGRPLRSPHAPAAAALPLCRVTATAASLAGHQTSLPR